MESRVGVCGSRPRGEDFADGVDRPCQLPGAEILLPALPVQICKDKE